VVLSDLTRDHGDAPVDQQRSWNSLAQEWARLLPGWHFLVKVFEGPDTSALAAVLKKNFSICRPLKPAGSRPASREIYLLGLKKRGAPPSPAPIRPPAASTSSRLTVFGKFLKKSMT
jgi:23S rRNA (uridine2552-2'-O)-methyltransferase